MGVPLQKPSPLAILSHLQFGVTRITKVAVMSVAISREESDGRRVASAPVLLEFLQGSAEKLNLENRNNENTDSDRG